MAYHQKSRRDVVPKSCLTLCNPMDCSTPGFPVPYYLPELLKLMSIKSLMPSSHLILCCPLFLLPLVFPSIRVFSNESSLHITWPKYWSFSISSSNGYSRLISFRMDWFDLAVQGTLKSLLQHHNSKVSVLQCSAFFNFMAAVTVCSDFGTQENKICHCSHFFPLYLLWSDGAGFPT